MSERDAAAELMRLVNGYQVSQALHVVATLKIADLLAAGPRSSDELAAERQVHARSLYRVLRALAAVGVLSEGEDRTFTLTALGQGLRSNAAEPVGPWAEFIGRPYYWQAWSELMHSVRTGENAFRHVHGTDVWGYRSRQPEESAIFNRAMTGIARGVANAVIAAYDFSSAGLVVDIGGGQGALLAALLVMYPKARGVLFDQPHVVASAGQLLGGAGVGDRCEVVGGSFFEAVPEGGDVYLLKAVLHDWDDAASHVILETCCRAMRPEAKLLVLERVIAPPNEDADAKLADLNMLVAPGGQERDRDEFEVLLAAAGLRLTRVIPTGTAFSVIEAVPS